MDTFSVGAQVMVPFQGLCEIVGAQKEEILGKETLFYQIQPVGSPTLLKIPAHQMLKQGIRLKASADQIEEILEATPEAFHYKRERPFTRMRMWTQLLRSGQPGCRRELLRRLDLVEQAGEKLTREEIALRERVRSAFRHEVEAVLDISTLHAGKRVNESVLAS